jgi:uncharacterized protein YraI
MNAQQQTGIIGPSTAALVLALAAWTPAAVAAVTATLTAAVHLRAGPAIVYPSVLVLPPGSVVQVFGCEEGYDWCDVQMGAERGWVDAAFLQAPAPSGPVVIANSPAVMGVPVVAFSFNTYWSTYYVGRPWYTRRAYYYNYWNRYPHGRPPPIYRPPPPRPTPYRPPPGVRPPGGRPPSGGGRPPGSGKPPPGNRPPVSTRPAPVTSQ